MKQIIVINGQGGAGKDALINLIAGRQKRVMNISSVDGVKELAKIVGWNGSKEEKDRKFLSDLKILTSEYCGFSENYLVEKTKEFLKSKDELMFVHIREPFFIGEFLNKFPSAKTLLIRRGESSSYGNMADDNVFNYDYDYIIDNCGSLEDLEEKGIQLLESLGFSFP